MLGTVAVPTLLLHGEGDARTPRRVADDLHARIPGSRLVVLPGVGHVCNLEAPELFDAEVRASGTRCPADAAPPRRRADVWSTRDARRPSHPGGRPTRRAHPWSRRGYSRGSRGEEVVMSPPENAGIGTL